MKLNKDDLQLWLAFIRTNAWLGQRLSRDMLENDGVRITWYDVLVHLYHCDVRERGLRMQDLIDNVIISNSGMTRVVDRLVEEGLVQRSFSEHDRREVYVAITDEGIELIERLLKRHQARIDEYFIQHLSEEEKAVMLKALRRIQDAHGITQAKAPISED